MEAVMWYPNDDYLREDELADLRYEERVRRRNQCQLSRHPDPRDPDHPEIYEGEDDELQP